MDLQDQPATKGDVQALKIDLEQRMDSFEQRIEGRMDSFEQRIEGRMDVQEQRITDRMMEALRETETKLLQAFYGFAETNNRRLTQGEASTTIMVARLTTLETRVMELEKRLNMPPAA